MGPTPGSPKIKLDKLDLAPIVGTEDDSIDAMIQQHHLGHEDEKLGNLRLDLMVNIVAI